MSGPQPWPGLRYLLRTIRPPLMPTFHGVDPGDYTVASRVLGCIAGRVIACAPSVARSLQAAGFPDDRIDVITNGAALCPAGLEREASLRQSLALGRGPLVLGIGRLVEQKNWPVFIEAVSHLTGPSFAVAGEGPLKQQLVDLARPRESPIRFLGAVHDIAALLGAGLLRRLYLELGGASACAPRSALVGRPGRGHGGRWRYGRGPAGGSPASAAWRRCRG